MIEKSEVKKKIWAKMFYGCKLISSKIGFEGKKFEKNFLRNVFGRKLFMVAKSFPRKQVWKRNILGKFLGREFLWLQNHFLENRFERKKIQKNFWEMCFGPNFFLFVKSFPRKQVCKKTILTKRF